MKPGIGAGWGSGVPVALGESAWCSTPPPSRGTGKGALRCAGFWKPLESSHPEVQGLRGSRRAQFGLSVRGGVDSHSDLDVLVVTPDEPAKT